MLVGMAKVWRVLRTNPKKSIAATAFTAYGCSYLIDRYNDEILRRKLCNSVKPLGDAAVRADHRLRRLTVFLNPFARRGKLLKEFEKNVAPILQLSGLDIHMVYSDNDTEIKDFVSVLDTSGTDGILVASDDHVLQKAVTALLQRSDFKTSHLSATPVGVIPVGVWNTFAHSFAQSKNAIQFCYDILTPILTEKTKQTHVLEISATQPVHTNLTPAAPDPASPNTGSNDSENDSSPAPAVRITYSMLGLEWSIWRDVELGGGAGASKRKAKPVDTNEQRGPLMPLSALSPLTWKRHLGVIWRETWFWLTSTRPPVNASNDQVLSALSPTEQPTSVVPKHRLRAKQAKLVYTPACEGCSKCWESRMQAENSGPKDPVKRKPSSTFSQLLGLSRVRTQGTNNSNPEPVEDRSGVINDECGREYTLELYDAASVVLVLDKDRIRVDIQPTPSGLLDHLRQSIGRLKSDQYQDNGPNPDSSATTSFYCATVTLQPEILQNEFYWIDNDHFEACPITVRVRRNAIKMFQ